MIAFSTGWLLAALLACGGPGADPDRAARAYHAGRYEEALALYEAAWDEPGIDRAAVSFNLGNCAYRLGRYSRAVLYYRRAQLRSPHDPQIEFNLKLALEQLGVFSAPDDSLGAALLGRWDRPGVGAQLLIALFLQTAALVGLALRPRRGVAVAATLAFLVGTAFAARVVRLQWFAAPAHGVVLDDDIAIRREPHRDLPATVRLAAGETVRVAEWSDRWMRIDHARGGGWTERGGVGIVH